MSGSFTQSFRYIMALTVFYIDQISGTPLRYECPVCRLEFGVETQFVDHIVASHQSFPLVCHFCNKKFVLAEGLVYHLTSAHLSSDERQHEQQLAYRVLLKFHQS